ncbi:unnamed protein product [Rhodiola kirilowii]
MEKENGGLGLKRLELMNLALLAKQGWRIMTKRELLVSKIFQAKYFPGMRLVEAQIGNRPSYAWRGIMEAADIIRHGAEWVDGEETYSWKKDGSGEFTVKGAYLCALEIDKFRSPPRGEQSDGSDSRKFWRKFWRLQVPERIKHFGWRLFHDSLPTRMNLLRRGCDVENVCAHCGGSGESTMHLFKDCWWIRALFEGSQLPDEVWNNHCADTSYWLWLCGKVCSESEFTELLCGLWLGWKDRNEVVHGKEGKDLNSLKVSLRFLLGEIRTGPLRRITRSIDLQADHEGLVVMCDGSFGVDLRRGGWGVVAMRNGLVETAMAGWWDGVATSFEAECEAMQQGFALAKFLHVRKATFVTDSAEVAWAINAGSWRPDASLERIRKCIAMMDEQSDWSVMSVARDCNQAADWLSKRARLDEWTWCNPMAIPRFSSRLLRL